MSEPTSSSRTFPLDGRGCRNRSPDSLRFLMISRRHPNILYLAHRVPYPPNRGDRIRSFHTLQFLSRYANVCLACLSDETVERETVAQLQELVSRVAIVRLPDNARWLRG